MNVAQLGQGPNAENAPHLWLTLVISLGGTAAFAGLILLGVKVWRRYYRQPRQRRQWLEKLEQV